MDRFYCPDLPTDLPAGTEIDLDGDEAHHLSRVKRMGPGERVLVFDGRGREAPAEVASIDRRGKVRLSILPSDFSSARELSTRIAIGVAPPKGKRMSLLLEKATELGVASIFPLLTERSVVDVRDREEHKAEKWRRTTIEAAKQCGVLRLPDIEPTRTLDEALALESALRLVLDPRPTAQPLREILRAPRPSVLALIGPEGGFTDAEFVRARLAGFLATSLGPTVLRVETAAIAAVAAIAALSG